MSRAKTRFSASQVRELLSAKVSDAEKMTRLGDVGPADLEAVRLLIAGLEEGQHRIVLGCAEALGEADAQSAEEAVAGLLPHLNHSYPVVRAVVAQSLARLCFLAEVPVIPLWEALLGEEELTAYFAIGRALLTCLRTSCPPVPASVGKKLHALLTEILDLRVTHLPLAGDVSRRNEPSGHRAQPPGIMARLLGAQPQAGPPPDPPPRPLVMDKRRFLTPDEDRVRDMPEVVSLLAQLYVYVPSDARARLSLLLELCQMPLSSFETSESLVLVAAGLVRDNAEKAALLASMWGWGRAYDPTWTGRLALSAARARPDLRLPLFQFLRARQARIDWTTWANSLRELSPIELEPLLAATLAAPDSDLGGYMRLLSQAPIEHIVPALARALNSAELEVAAAALERLLERGQPVPWLLNDIQSLRQRWAMEFAFLKGLDMLMSHPRPPSTAEDPLPEGTREPDWIVEWMLEDDAANPFSQGRVMPWRESLQQLNAFYVKGGDLQLLSTSKLVTMSREAAPVARSLPAETTGAGMTLLAAGDDGNVLFVGRGREQVYLYLLWRGARDLHRLEPSLPSDEVPAPGQVMTDGRQYGWAMQLERQSRAAEGGLTLRKDVAYSVDPEAGQLRPVYLDGMRPLETMKIETADESLSPLAFRFSLCGGFRVSQSEGLAIRSGEENPVYSQGRVDGKLAIHLEVFPSRLCRVYLWGS